MNWFISGAIILVIVLSYKVKYSKQISHTNGGVEIYRYQMNPTGEPKIWKFQNRIRETSNE